MGFTILCFFYYYYCLVGIFYRRLMRSGGNFSKRLIHCFNDREKPIYRTRRSKISNTDGQHQVFKLQFHTGLTIEFWNFFYYLFTCIISMVYLPMDLWRCLIVVVVAVVVGVAAAESATVEVVPKIEPRTRPVQSPSKQDLRYTCCGTVVILVWYFFFFFFFKINFLCKSIKEKYT